ncbi:hypothetical protein GRI33_06170 [Brucella sp. BO3]|uniref:hypothetical protein n=1 Tax=unclassified Brucella TaxID=2632610 RepID=UPI00084FAD26|nr:MULTISPECIES: hypothetical protein [unclassified Brucella]OEI83702.1 hypothetical protein BA060_06915 [Brucella sp. B13-0095]QMV26535.1 hypothetical protein GRI33_06170 [Brucella sp. BO3]
MSEGDQEFTIKFRPIERETLSLLLSVHEAEGDPIETFNRLLSACFVSAAMIEITPEQICEYATLMMPMARRAILERRDIFGGRSDEAES